jgi:hypothetical protein
VKPEALREDAKLAGARSQASLLKLFFAHRRGPQCCRLGRSLKSLRCYSRQFDRVGSLLLCQFVLPRRAAGARPSRKRTPPTNPGRVLAPVRPRCRRLCTPHTRSSAGDSGHKPVRSPARVSSDSRKQGTRVRARSWPRHQFRCLCAINGKARQRF